MASMLDFSIFLSVAANAKETISADVSAKQHMNLHSAYPFDIHCISTHTHRSPVLLDRIWPMRALVKIQEHEIFGSIVHVLVAMHHVKRDDGALVGEE